jgi:hypothetical protein
MRRPEPLISTRAAACLVYGCGLGQFSRVEMPEDVPPTLRRDIIDCTVSVRFVPKIPFQKVGEMDRRRNFTCTSQRLYLDWHARLSVRKCIHVETTYVIWYITINIVAARSNIPLCTSNITVSFMQQESAPFPGPAELAFIPEIEQDFGIPPLDFPFLIHGLPAP